MPSDFIRSRLAFCAVVALASVLSVRGEEMLKLVEDSRPLASILITEAELAYAKGHTAFDLQQYVHAHTGAKLPIVREGKGKIGTPNVISVGPTELAKKHGVDASTLPGDCGIIRRVGNVLFIVGRDARKEQAFSPYSTPRSDSSWARSVRWCTS